MKYDTPYFSTLERIRSFLEQQEVVQWHHFPRGWCDTTSELVRRIVGLELKGGYYVKSGFSKSHRWNYDLDRGLYVDLTQDQFGFTTRRIVILPSSTRLLKAGWDYELDIHPRRRADILERAYRRCNP